MKGLYLKVEISTMQGENIGEAKCCPELGAWKSR
jgi:hypothetical protein